MGKLKIKSYLSFKYAEVYEITKWKDGCIFETKKLNKFISNADEMKINRNKFTTTSISWTDSKFITLDIEEAAFFK